MQVTVEHQSIPIKRCMRTSCSPMECLSW
jgi:hypothetical protein